MKKFLQMMVLPLLVSICVFTGCGNSNSLPGESEAQTENETQEEENSQIESETQEEEDSQIESEIQTEEDAQVESETQEEEDSQIESETQTEEDAPPAHKHSYKESVTNKATCTKEGLKTFTCECGDTYTSAIKVTEHNYGKFVYNNDATQQKDGTQSRTCGTCGKVDTQTAKGTKLPLDPYSLKAVTSLSNIPSAGKVTSSDSTAYTQVINNIKAGKYEKVRYVASNGDQFCMWNVSLVDERSIEYTGKASIYWFMAPINGNFSTGYNYCNLSGIDTKDVDLRLIALGNNISSEFNESMLGRNTNIPLANRTINSSSCPVKLYEIVETDTMISVWVESTNCGQAGVGTCGSFNCTGTCLRSTTLKRLGEIPGEKGWGFHFLSGENGRINWNGKLLVNYYYMKY